MWHVRGVAEGVSFVPFEPGLMGDAVERIVLQLGGTPTESWVFPHKERLSGS